MTTATLPTGIARPARSPAPQYPRIHAHWRAAGVVCAVAVAHFALLWAAFQAVQRPDPMPEAEVIMASVLLKRAPQATAPLQKAAPPPPKPQALAKPAAPARHSNLTIPVAVPGLAVQNHHVPSAIASTAQAYATAAASPSGAVSNTMQGSVNVTASGAASNASPQSVVVLPSADADYLNNAAPPYPRLSRRMGEEGTVIVRVLISVQGSAEKAELRTSSGYYRLDQAAMETVQRWRYVPGKRNGEAVAMWFNVPVRFVLE